MRFSADDKMLQVLRHAIQWVVGVDQPPVVHWITVIIVRPVRCSIAVVEVKPLPVTAVEVPVFVVACNDLVALLRDFGNRFVTEPTLHNSVLRQSEIEVQEHLLPYERLKTLLSELVLITIHELLKKRDQHG